jgi:hypothetical protein
MAGNALHPEPREFTENGANLVYLRAQELGVDPEGTYRTHALQFTGLAGGSVNVDMVGPAGTYAPVTTGKIEDDVLFVTVPFRELRCTFVGTGGAGKVTVASYQTQGL